MTDEQVLASIVKHFRMGSPFGMTLNRAELDEHKARGACPACTKDLRTMQERLSRDSLAGVR